jgi:hypothetical protein
MSELLGGFGDNEFMPEILEAAASLFYVKETSVWGQPVSIPRAYSVFMCPVVSLSFAAYLRTIPSSRRPSEHCHILGLKFTSKSPESNNPDRSIEATVLCPALPVYSSLCTVSGLSEGTIDFTFSSEVDISGLAFAGYFVAELVPGIFIDTRPIETVGLPVPSLCSCSSACSCASRTLQGYGRNAFHWVLLVLMIPSHFSQETFLVPVDTLNRVPDRVKPISLHLKRCFQPACDEHSERLWYQ